MGYYQICFRYSTGNLCIIILYWVKKSNKLLLMGDSTPPDTFQGKMNEIV